MQVRTFIWFNLHIIFHRTNYNTSLSRTYQWLLFNHLSEMGITRWRLFGWSMLITISRLFPFIRLRKGDHAPRNNAHTCFVPSQCFQFLVLTRLNANYLTSFHNQIICSFHMGILAKVLRSNSKYLICLLPTWKLWSSSKLSSYFLKWAYEVIESELEV